MSPECFHAGPVERLRKRIAEKELSFSFARSGGPGGQNVNKLSTRVTLWFDLAASRSLTAAEKHTIRRKLTGRIGCDGRLRVVSRRHRTQAANRRAAVERFFQLLADALAPARVRTPTRVPAGQKRRRLDEKRRISVVKRLRRGGTPSDDNE